MSPRQGPIFVPSLTPLGAKEGDALVNSDIAFTVKPKWIIVSPKLYYLPKLSPRRPLALRRKKGLESYSCVPEGKGQG